jgi:hypothetical protein
MRLLKKNESAKALNIHPHTLIRLLRRQLVTPTAFDNAGFPLFSELALRQAAKYANAVRKNRQEVN